MSDDNKEKSFRKDVGYNDDTNNYRIEGELMVTITLNEYRKLVSIAAKQSFSNDLDNATKGKAKAEQEANSFRQVNEKLQETIERYKKSFGSLPELDVEA